MSCQGPHKYPSMVHVLLRTPLWLGPPLPGGAVWPGVVPEHEPPGRKADLGRGAGERQRVLWAGTELGWMDSHLRRLLPWLPPPPALTGQ